MARILVVEDTSALREEIRFILEMEGYSVTEAGDGHKAYALLQQNDFDLIVCDIMMPKMDGIELLRKMEEDSSQIRPAFIFLTARASSKDLRKGMGSGADDYLIKPFDADSLLSAVEIRIRKRNNLLKLMEKATQEVKVLYEEELSRKESEAQRQFTDHVTGLPNRMAFEVHFDNMLSEECGAGERIACGMIRIDNYSQALRAFGLEFAHSVSKEAANRLRELFSDDGHFFSLDEKCFIVLIQHKTLNELEESAKRIQSSFAKAIRVHDKELRLRVSIGIHSSVIGSGEKRGQVTAKAEEALFVSRNRKYGQFHVFDEDDGSKEMSDVELETDLFRAVEEENIQVYYQPKLDARTKYMVGMEALVRWNHPQAGFVSPGVFIPWAEDSGLIVELGKKVMAKAINDTKKIHDLGYPISCSVNISPLQWQNDNVPELIESELSKSQLPPQSLCIELTESGVVEDFEQVVSLLNCLRDKGIHVSLDDFGTGFSSFSMLSKIPLDELKIDRAFVKNIPGDHDGEHIAKAIIDVGKGLGLQLVAEGIETKEQSVWLAEQGCTVLQGFLFAKPMPYSDLVTFLKKTNQS